MKHFTAVLLVILLFLVGSVVAQPAAYCLPTIYSTIANSSVNSGKYSVEVWDVASDNVLITNINFAFTLNSSALDTNSIVVTFAGRYSAYTYEWHAVSSNQIAIQMSGNAVTPTTLYGGEKIITVTMDIKDPSATANFSWPKYGTPAYTYNQGFVGFSFQIFEGGDNIPLPITLASFNVNEVNGYATLVWTTVSETNNYGFYLQRGSSRDNLSDAEDGFVAGHGTSLQQHEYSWTDKSPAAYYRLRQVDLDGTSHLSDAIPFTLTDIAPKTNSPETFVLEQNYPNPFNPSTTIKYELAKTSDVRLSVHDMLGCEVSLLVNGSRDAGVHEVKFDASGLSSGVYFYRLSVSSLARRDLGTQERDGQTGGFTQTKRLMLLK